MKVDPGQIADQEIHATDADGDPLTFGKLSGPYYMTVTTTDPGSGTATGNIHLAPPLDTPIGLTSALVTVSDGVTRGQASVSILISTNAPTLDPPSDMTVAEASYAEQILTGSDPDLDPLTFSLVAGPSFATVATTDFEQGVMRLTPGVADEGVYPIVVAAGDGTASDSKTLTVTVTHTNAAPELEQPADMTVNSGETADQTLGASDFDGQPLSFLGGGPAFVTFATTEPGTGSATGNVHVAPTVTDATWPEAGAQHYNAFAQVSDGMLANTKLFQITVNYPADNPPSFDPPGDMTVTQGTSATMALTGTDPDGDPVGFLKSEGPEFVRVESNFLGSGRVVAQPSFADSGSYLVVARAVDRRGLIDEKAFHVIVSDGDEPPHIVSLRNMVAFSGYVVVQDFRAYDPEGNAVTISKAYGPAFMTVETVISSSAGATGRVRLAPGSGDLGKTTGGIAVSDGALVEQGSFAIDVHPPDVPVLTTPIFGLCMIPGETFTYTLRAVDPEGDRLVYSQTGLPTYAALSDSGNGTASLTVAPGYGDPSAGFVTITVSDGIHQDAAIFSITVGSYWQCGRGTGSILTSDGANRSPVAVIGGPYAGIAGIPLHFDGSQSSDPDGTPLELAWNFGDGAVALGPTPDHVYARGAPYVVSLIVSDGYITGRKTTSALIADALPARAFTAPGQTRVRLFSGKPSLAVNLEPSSASFQLSDLDPATLAMVSTGTGSVDRIAAIDRKGAAVEDSDGNGIEEIRAWFAQADLRRLFDHVNGVVTVHVEGNLHTGPRVRGDMALTVIRDHGPSSASVWPNPMNPSGALRFATDVAGQVDVRVFQLSGRLVRTLLSRRLEPGEHEVRIDGRDDEVGPWPPEFISTGSICRAGPPRDGSL